MGYQRKQYNLHFVPNIGSRLNRFLHNASFILEMSWRLWSWGMNRDRTGDNEKNLFLVTNQKTEHLTCEVLSRCIWGGWGRGSYIWL